MRFRSAAGATHLIGKNPLRISPEQQIGIA
jgi:hypothetical protein